ncbi:hypothetical protein SAMN02745244_01782 [Tessaracoccus bendigoensis DSM 12906]|uniref:Uncharacterized protein n=1 Tax=Tessaracoccus bendigoensis DSM 12906 TaxID=1123357 RepID=A0A1M6GSV6_9ACTN|nr:hypothetical protein [Tessaracoccus bendigoensis]SHJ13048.1 hypothetical protein SAMN02745244_01782 [Tessaracoccus bendigoensis DSM 12906]
MAISETERARIRAVKERVEDDLLNLPGVTGVDIDESYEGGEPTGEGALVVFVAHKRPLTEIPEAELIPATIDGVSTDVREMRIVKQDPQT